MPRRTPQEIEEFRRWWEAEQREFEKIGRIFDRLLLVALVVAVTTWATSVPYSRIWHSIRETPQHPFSIHEMAASLGKDIIFRARLRVQLDH